MKVSNLNLSGQMHLVENVEGGYRVIKTQADIDQYIGEFGDLGIVKAEWQPSKLATTWAVPELAARRDMMAKGIDQECAKWGCE